MKPTTISLSTLDFLRPGLINPAVFPQKMVLVLKDYGKTKTVYAIGGKFAYLNTSQGPIDTKVSGKIQEKRFGSLEFLFSSMKRTLEFSLEDLELLITNVSMPTLSSSITTTLRTCQSIRFQRLRANKLTGFSL